VARTVTDLIEESRLGMAPSNVWATSHALDRLRPSEEAESTRIIKAVTRAFGGLSQRDFAAFPRVGFLDGLPTVTVSRQRHPEPSRELIRQTLRPRFTGVSQEERRRLLEDAVRVTLGGAGMEARRGTGGLAAEWIADVGVLVDGVPRVEIEVRNRRWEYLDRLCAKDQAKFLWLSRRGIVPVLVCPRATLRLLAQADRAGALVVQLDRFAAYDWYAERLREVGLVWDAFDPSDYGGELPPDLARALVARVTEAIKSGAAERLHLPAGNRPKRHTQSSRRARSEVTRLLADERARRRVRAAWAMLSASPVSDTRLCQVETCRNPLVAVAGRQACLDPDCPMYELGQPAAARTVGEAARLLGISARSLEKEARRLGESLLA
jgi:hypothetical protein